jgi:hypothetical protein
MTMARNDRLAAGVFSLVFAGPWAVAQANSQSSTVGHEQGVVRILGASFCMPDAPPDVACTWRLPRASSVESSAERAPSQDLASSESAAAHTSGTDRARFEAALGDVRAAVGRMLARLGFEEQEPTDLQARR